MKPKKCKVCKGEYTPSRPMQSVCSPICGLAKARIAREKKAAQETRKAKQSIKTRGQWLKEAQAAFNKYIRLRDKDLPCISCGRFHSGQYHAGHYRTVGAHPELRFNEYNVQKQCAPCNNHKSGNIVEYRIALISRVGLDKVSWLEGPHELKKWTIEEIKEIKRKYSKMARELENNDRP